jgi:two-component system sensor histidine kinase UhpB
MFDTFFRNLSAVAWFGRSIRHQVLLAISLMLAVATIAAGTIAVVNGRNAVDVEIEASMDFAEGYLRELVRRITAENQLGNLEYLVSREVEHLRHARVYVQDVGAEPKLLRSSALLDADPSPSNETPDWFERLMMPKGGESHTRLILVPKGERQIILKGDPDDEIAEKWQELSSLAIVASISMVLLVGAFYFVLGWILTPLQALARGLVALEAGESARRLEIPRVVEIADISRKFNSLAASLDQTRAENGELYKQIQSVQEDERREIARELHDEAGPCLFGITASAESIGRISGKLDGEPAKRITARTDEILSITDRMKAMNRALLKRLHPVSIGKVPLPALIKDLINDFDRRHPEVRIVTEIGPFVRAYGEKVDLTVYRATQEALTNAVRHSEADNITVELREEASHMPQPGQDSGVLISLRVSDDGIGLKPGAHAGFGLSAMRERVLSAGGTLAVEAQDPHGTAISIKIPAQPSEPLRLLVREAPRITT